MYGLCIYVEHHGLPADPLGRCPPRWPVKSIDQTAQFPHPWYRSVILDMQLIAFSTHQSAVYSVHTVSAGTYIVTVDTNSFTFLQALVAEREWVGYVRGNTAVMFQS